MVLLSSRTWLAPVTLATRADEAGGPPPSKFYERRDNLRLQVLVAECIPIEDPVGVLSRAGWRVATEHWESASEQINLEMAEGSSVDALREVIADRHPDVLIISAHGTLSKNRNVAGLAIGEEVVLGPGLGPLPPVVILSACHS